MNEILSRRMNTERASFEKVELLLHPLVTEMAKAMQRKLEARKGRKHWSGETVDDLWQGMDLEEAELQEAKGTDAVDEAADVALYAAFIAAKKV